MYSSCESPFNPLDVFLISNVLSSATGLSLGIGSISRSERVSSTCVLNSGPHTAGLPVAAKADVSISAVDFPHFPRPYDATIYRLSQTPWVARSPARQSRPEVDHRYVSRAVALLDYPLKARISYSLLTYV